MAAAGELMEMAEKTTPAKKPAARKPAKKAAPAKAKPAAKRTTAARPAAAKAAPAKAKPAAKPTAKPKPAAKQPARKPAERRSKRTTAARTDAEAARDVALFDNFAAIRDLLAEHVVLSAERLQESLDDAVRRGRMLPLDAEELTQRLVAAGRRHADELRAEFEARLKR